MGVNVGWMEDEADREQRRLETVVDKYRPVGKPSKKRQLTLQRIDGLLANPKPLTWLIHKHFELDTLAQIFGDPGGGKSFVGIDLTCCVGTGTYWNGCRVLQGAAFYIAGEGGNGLARRFDAWQKANGIPLDGAPIYISNMAASLTDEIGVSELLELIRSMAAEYGKPVLIVLDTVARNFGGGDENNTQDMVSFIAACDAIREETGATILLIHHSGHGDKKRSRGSSALRGALDCEFSLTKDAGAIQLECTKMKDAESPQPRAFGLYTVDLGYVDEEGEAVTSAVLRPAIYIRSAKGKAGRGANQTLALRVLKEAQQKREDELTSQGIDPDLGYVELADWKELCFANGLKGNRFSEIVDSLGRAGLIRRDGDHITPGTGESWELKE